MSFGGMEACPEIHLAHDVSKIQLLTENPIPVVFGRPGISMIQARTESILLYCIEDFKVTWTLATSFKSAESRILTWPTNLEPLERSMKDLRSGESGISKEESAW